MTKKEFIDKMLKFEIDKDVVLPVANELDKYNKIYQKDFFSKAIELYKTDKQKFDYLISLITSSMETDKENIITITITHDFYDNNHNAVEVEINLDIELVHDDGRGIVRKAEPHIPKNTKLDKKDIYEYCKNLENKHVTFFNGVELIWGWFMYEGKNIFALEKEG